MGLAFVLDLEARLEFSSVEILVIRCTRKLLDLLSIGHLKGNRK